MPAHTHTRDWTADTAAPLARPLSLVERPPSTPLTAGARWRVPAWLLYPGGLLVAVAVGLATAVNPLAGAGVLVFVLCVAAGIHSGVLVVNLFALASYFEFTTQWTGDALSPTKLVGGGLVVIAAITLAGRARLSVWQRRARDDAPAWFARPWLLFALGVLVTMAAASTMWAANPARTEEDAIHLAALAGVLLAMPVFLQRMRHLRALAWTVLAGATSSVLLGAALGSNVVDRSIGTFFDPNEFSAALVPAVVLGFAVAEATPQRGRRWCARALALVCIFGIVQSQSRGGMVALAVAMVVLLATSRGTMRWRMGALTTVLTIGAVSALLLTPAGVALAERIATGDSSGRADLWRVAWYEFTGNPVGGVGLGNYAERAQEYARSTVHDTQNLGRLAVHNTALELLAELGLVGLAAFTGVVGAALVGGMRALRAARRRLPGLDDPLIPLGQGLLAGTAGALASGVFLSGAYQEVLWLQLGALVAYPALVARATRRSGDAATALTAPSTP